MIQVNRIYLIFNRLVTKKFLVDTSDDETKCSFKGNKVFPLMKQTVRLRETLCSVWQNTFYLLICF